MAYQGRAGSDGRFHRPREVPPLRSAPRQADDQDAERCAYLKSLWHEQDDPLRPRDRQIEENIRMLCGQQWLVWSELQARYIDLAETLDDDERRWRHMPTMNRLFLWYVLLHSRMTESPPTLSWLPGPDRIDAIAAELADVVYKYLWRDIGMIEVIDRLMAYLIPSGQAYLQTRIDPTKGDPIVAKGPALLSLLEPGGGHILGLDGQPIQRFVEDANYGEDGEPVGRLYEGEDGELEIEEGDPYVFSEGSLTVDVLAAPECRGAWGTTPWHQKPYHIRRSLLSPMEFYEAFGMEGEPDVTGEGIEDLGLLWRILQGAGFFGSAEARTGRDTQTLGPGHEFVTVYEGWFRPSRLPGMRETPESPGGRLLTVTGGGKVVRDGVRPARFRYTSPIRCFNFVNLPGRPSGTSPQEMLNGPIRTRNRFFGQQFQHASLSANPTKIVDIGAGLEEGDLTNQPGEEVYVDRSKSPGSPVIEFAQPPSLGREVGESILAITQEIDQIGSISGSTGDPPARDPSGTLVQELRFNADRPIGSTMKRAVFELGRLGEDWMAYAPIVWDEEKVIRIVGDDGIARIMTVMPAVFEQGSVNVEPHIESMLPEGRGERQLRVWNMWQGGVWGDPLSPTAINTFLDQARYPNLNAATRPGGEDRSMAEQNVGRLLQGTPAQEIQIFEWYDHALHRYVLERYMKSPEYLKLDLGIATEFYNHRQNLQQAEAFAAAMAADRELQLSSAVQAAEVETAAPIQRRMAETASAAAADMGATAREAPGSRSPGAATASTAA